jgi:hypothetical protein
LMQVLGWGSGMGIESYGAGRKCESLWSIGTILAIP